MYTFQLRIGGIPFCFESASESIIQKLEIRFKEFKEHKKALLPVRIAINNKPYTIPCHKTGKEFFLGTAVSIFEAGGSWWISHPRYVARIRGNELSFSYFQGHMFHLLDFEQFFRIVLFDFIFPVYDCVAINGMAFKRKNAQEVTICIGHSEVGKSTLARKLMSKSGYQVLNDDVIILKQRGNRFFCYSSPFMRRTNLFLNYSGPVKECLFLVKDSSDFKRTLSDCSIIVKNIKQAMYLFFTGLQTSFKLNFILNLTQNLKFYQYHFKK